jgi:hypothetical protein
VLIRFNQKMKKTMTKFWVLLAIAISPTWCLLAQTRTLNLSDRSFTYNSGDPSNCKGGNFWTATYDGDTTSFKVGSFVFSHNSGFDIYSYWGGFTVSKNADSLCYTTSCTSLSHLSSCAQSGSNGWIYNQWGIRAGGGIAAISGTTVTAVSNTIPYLVAYWDYYSDGIDPTSRSLQIKLNGDSLFNLTELYVCNHPWPYYGNIYGDGFARPLDQPGDYFRLYIHGVPNSGSELVDSLTLEHYDVNETNYISQSPNWTRKGLNTRWKNLKSVYFTMKSTDELIIGSTNYGPNTAVYFCLDKVKVTKTGLVATSSAVQKAKFLADKKSVQITDYFPITSYAGGEVIVFNENNKEVLHSSVKAGDKINLSDLPDGNYRLKHGSKIIPITKIRTERK